METRAVRITFVLPYAALNGGHRVVAAYARHLTEQGHEVWAVSQPYRQRGGVRAKLTRLVRGAPPQPPRIPLLDFLGDRHLVLKTPRPVTAANLPDADVIVATWWETAEWVAPLPPSKGRKAYLIQDYEMFQPGTFERVAATYQLPFLRIAVSDYSRDAIRTRHGVSDIAVIPNAVDTSHFGAPPRARNEALTVGFVYTRTPRKNVRLAIDALQAARRQVPHLRAISFGSAPPSPELALPDWVEFRLAPPQEEIPALYASCDLWLLTSDREGFGLPILEAMACRTPVVSTPAGAAETLIDGSNGMVVAPEVDAVVEAILRFDRMRPEEWSAFSESARRTVNSYTWDDATDRLVALLSSSENAPRRAGQAALQP